MSNRDINRILFELGESENPWNAVTPPLVRTSNFSFPTVSAFTDAIAHEKNTHIYSRGNNPTVRLLEKKLAALQGMEDALCFGSGSAALSAAIASQLKAGDHVICVRHCYSWTHKLLTEWLPRFGVETTFVDGFSLDQFMEARKSNTKLVVLESPTSVRMRLQPVAEVAAWAKREHLVTLIDYSYGSPLCTKPADAGIDLICHTATKFIGGHSDILGGVVCGSAGMIESLFKNEYMTFGAVLSPDNAALFTRSLRTLPMRMERQSKTVKEVVAFLAAHPAVGEVIWPFHPSHPDYTRCNEQFDFEIPLFSIVLKTDDRTRIVAFLESLCTFRMAVSWGGFESLVLPCVAFNHPDWPVNLVRMYVGFEDAAYLCDDLSQALQHCA
ncbi:MAG: PLP-dependent transferase [Flavobacteriales bacterium]|nr:PLP-dependent transferase [Flavobacteriales bacterium]